MSKRIFKSLEFSPACGRFSGLYRLERQKTHRFLGCAAGESKGRVQLGARRRRYMPKDFSRSSHGATLLQAIASLPPLDAPRAGKLSLSHGKSQNAYACLARWAEMKTLSYLI